MLSFDFSLGGIAFIKLVSELEAEPPRSGSIHDLEGYFESVAVQRFQNKKLVASQRKRKVSAFGGGANLSSREQSMRTRQKQSIGNLQLPR